MLKRIFLIFSLLVTVAVLKAQCFQTVRVMEYKGEGIKTPLANVEVIVGNAGSVVTDKRGLCRLQFRTLKPGDKVNVRRIEKAGYELLDKAALDQWFISGNANDEFVIVMTSSKRVKAERDKYMRTAEKNLSDELSRQQTAINRQLNDNQISKDEYERKLQQIRDEYNEKLDNIDNFIEHIVHTDISAMAAEEKAILSMVKNGDFSGALAEYEKIDLLSIYKQQVKEMNALTNASQKISNEIEKTDGDRLAVYQSIKRQNDLYRIAGGKDNVDAGIKLWHDFAFADTTFAIPLLEYAKYCERSNRVAEALDAVRYCVNSADNVTKLRATLLQVQLMSKRSQTTKAMPLLEQTYHYMDSVMLAKGDSTLYLDERAYALYLLCKSYNYLSDEKSRQVRQAMVDVNCEAYERDTNNLEQKRQLVDVLYAAHRTEDRLCRNKNGVGYEKNPLEVSTYLAEAIALQKELYAAEPEKQAAMLAFLMCEKARVCGNFVVNDKMDLTKYDEVIKGYEEAINLYKIAYDHNPKAYAHFLAYTYCAYFETLLNLKYKIDKQSLLDIVSKAKYYEAMDHMYNPAGAQSTMGHIMSGFGIIYVYYKDYDAALPYLQEAETMLKPYYERYPKTYTPAMRVLYKNYYRIYEAKGDKAQCEFYGEKINQLQ